MHFLASLIIICCFVFVLFFGLVQVISDLSEMSVHTPPEILPEMLPARCGKVLEAERVHAGAKPCRLSRTRRSRRANVLAEIPDDR
jgi:hypothetical protein